MADAIIDLRHKLTAKRSREPNLNSDFSPMTSPVSKKPNKSSKTRISRSDSVSSESSITVSSSSVTVSNFDISEHEWFDIVEDEKHNESMDKANQNLERRERAKDARSRIISAQIQRFETKENTPPKKNWTKKKTNTETTVEVELEVDEEILRRRQKQIDYGKNTEGYQNYIIKVPFDQRTRAHPSTPNKSKKMSRRKWDGGIRIWRQLLHHFDNPETKSNVSISSIDSDSVINDDIDSVKDNTCGSSVNTSVSTVDDSDSEDDALTIAIEM